MEHTASVIRGACSLLPGVNKTVSSLCYSCGIIHVINFTIRIRVCTCLRVYICVYVCNIWPSRLAECWSSILLSRTFAHKSILNITSIVDCPQKWWNNRLLPSYRQPTFKHLPPDTLGISYLIMQRCISWNYAVRMASLNKPSRVTVLCTQLYKIQCNGDTLFKFGNVLLVAFGDRIKQEWIFLIFCWPCISKYLFINPYLTNVENRVSS